MDNYRVKDYKNVNKVLKEYMENKHRYIIIHYSGGNFYKNMYSTKSTRITSISIMRAGDDQMHTFSLLNSSIILGKDIRQMSEEEKDKVEKHMLTQYFDYVKHHYNDIDKWLHWNMRDNIFGFQAIEQRYDVLGGKNKCIIDDSKKINISRLLYQKYGPNYIQGDKNVGKMYKLFEMNNIVDDKILTGEPEAQAYENREYEKIDLSISEKVRSFSKMLDLAANDTLKTNCKKWRDIYGLSLSGIIQLIKDNAILAFIFSILGGVICNIITNLISK